MLFTKLTPRRSIERLEREVRINLVINGSIMPGAGTTANDLPPLCGSSRLRLALRSFPCATAVCHRRHGTNSSRHLLMNGDLSVAGNVDGLLIEAAFVIVLKTDGTRDRTVRMEAPPLERKLAAILAADVEGYSRLMNVDEEQTLATLSSHRTIVDGLIEKAHGQIFGTAGDSVLAEFPSVVLAFNAAVAIQQAMWRANQELAEDRRMNFRIGINVGDVLVKNGDIFGDGVNIAARLEGLADVGGICVTRGVRDHLRDRVDATFEDLGEQSIKNIARPLRVFRVIFDAKAEPILKDDPAPVERSDMRSSIEQSVSQDHDDDDEGSRVEVASWESVQESDDPAEYLLYLKRFPEGQFAELARTRLQSGGTGEHDPGVEVAFWETVRDAGNAGMIEAYLAKYPQGQFSDLARIMLADLGAKSPK
jgi:class 3 adenylate cyclase